MHTQPMSESEGEFQDGYRPAIKSDGKPWPCPHCKIPGKVEFRIWESSCGGYEDIKYHCHACGKTWWVEGADA